MSKQKDFYENRTVYLKPIPRASAIVGNDPKHIAYFKMENASDKYCLKQNENGGVVNPFDSEEEMKWFSEQIGEDLNPNKKGNKFWADYYVTVTKTPELMRIGKRFNLNNIRDLLDYKVLKTWKKEICANWDERFNGNFRYCFVDEDYEEKKSTESMDLNFKVGAIYGELKEKPNKLRDFLNIYYQLKAINKVVSKDSEVGFMVKEFEGLVKKDNIGVIGLYDNPNLKDMIFVTKAIDKDLINRKGVSTYIIQGLAVEYSYNELLGVIHKWAKEKIEPLYAKMLTIIDGE